MIDYLGASLESEYMYESKDCGVKAVSIACKKDYRTIHQEFKQLGRKNNCGSQPFWIHVLACRHSTDYKVLANKSKPMRQPNGSMYTKHTITNKLNKGRYICMTRTHAFAVIDGVIEDHEGNAKQRIHDIIEVKL